MGIYVIGSSNTDMVVKTGKIPAPGETVVGGTFFMNPGGKGANQAVAAARLGGSVTFIANVGNDLFGKQAIEQFQFENIQTSFVTTDPTLPSGVALINVDAQGENSITVAPGSNGNLQSEQVAQALDQLPGQGIVLIQLEIPLDTVETSIHMAKAKGHRVILNPAPARKLSEEIFQGLYLITPNETEAEILTGIPVTDATTARIAADHLLRMGVANVIITLGSKGAYLHTGDYKEIIPAPSVKAIDTTAAGDCFNGALAVALSESMTLRNAVIFAIQAASVSVTKMGAQASLPYLKEVSN